MEEPLPAQGWRGAGKAAVTHWPLGAVLKAGDAG